MKTYERKLLKKSDSRRKKGGSRKPSRYTSIKQYFKQEKPTCEIEKEFGFLISNIIYYYDSE